MPFQKGQSGNPGGRPKEVAEVRKLAQKHTDDAINTLVAMLKSKNDRTKVAAAEALLDRGWGRSQTPIKVEGESPFFEVLRAINEIRKGENALPAPAAAENDGQSIVRSLVVEQGAEDR
jgi:hypothetical protein